VLGGTAKIQSTLTSSGAIRQFKIGGRSPLSEQSGEMTERVRTLAACSLLRRRRSPSRPPTSFSGCGKAGSPPTRCGHDLSDAGDVGEDCPALPYGGELFLDSFSVVPHRSRQRSRAQQGFMRSWRRRSPSRIHNNATSMLRDVERGGRRRSSTSWLLLNKRARPILRIGHCCSPTRTSRLSSSACRRPFVLHLA